MDDDSRIGNGVKIGLGAVGLGAVAAVVMVPQYGIWIAIIILLLAALLFGGYFLWRRMQAKRQRENFTSAIEAQTAAAPKSISDPNKRAALDKLRQKFQTGMQEFKSRGKDIYKLPWYVIIGEPGSGKTEAIRHSGIDFPPGLQDELQGSGGTVNMDWWFTNRGIILDTAGSMIFGEANAGEAPEWKEFLRLLKKSRPHCPVNGLFLVLSIESLIKDSSDKIAQKASRLAQQLDLIQRTLDVRFPVYLLVTKCDLLTGFREFFDSIDDPLLQHQIFGWSNPDPLDSHFRPDLVDQHLNRVAERLRRRRMALLRDNSVAGRLGDTQMFSASYQLGRAPTIPRRMDEVDSMFALPESIMRLGPRLRRYLETVFVAGEWSAKPVFLRGIYFTTSMREGKALDEAIALATGLSLDQLPEERNWDKNRAFFLRDLFHEKIFREAGLVTRATNTLKLLRTRQLAIFGSAGAALLILMIFAWFGYRSLNRSVRSEAIYWSAAADTNNWNKEAWSLVHPGTTNQLVFAYAGNNPAPGLDEKLTVVDYQKRMRQLVSKQLSVSWIFKPIFWIGSRGAADRATAQRILFERGVLKPLVEQTRTKMTNPDINPATAAEVARHREALLALLQLEADGITAKNNGGDISSANAEMYLKTFLNYLTENDQQPLDTNIVEVFSWTYSHRGSGDGKWPPKFLLGGSTLSVNNAIRVGLEKFYTAGKSAQTNIDRELVLLNNLTDGLKAYRQAETTWLANTTDGNPCSTLSIAVAPKKEAVSVAWAKLSAATNIVSGPITNLSMRYGALSKAASDASTAALFVPVNRIVSGLPDASRTTGLFLELGQKLRQFIQQAGEGISTSYGARSNGMAAVDADQLTVINGRAVHEWRWNLYTNACALASEPIVVNDSMLGDGWTQFNNLQKRAAQLRANLAAYNGPLADITSNTCERIAGNAVEVLKHQFVDKYVSWVQKDLANFGSLAPTTPKELVNDGNLLAGVETDLKASASVLDDNEKKKLADLPDKVTQCRRAIMVNVGKLVRSKLVFPVLPSPAGSDKALSLKELGALRDTVNGFLGELQKTNWQAVGGDNRIVESGAARLRALLADSDTPQAAKCKIQFMPPKDDDANGSTIVIIYRFARFAMSGQTDAKWSDDLATAKNDQMVVGEGTLDAPLKLTFRPNSTDATGEAVKDYPNWGLLQLIYRSNTLDGTNWVIQVPLEKKQDNKTYEGNVSFKVVLEKPLPKIEDWLK